MARSRNLSSILREARHLVGQNPEMESSARLCLADAIQLRNEGDWDGAYARALASLAYSVGKFHSIYLYYQKGEER